MTWKHLAIVVVGLVFLANTHQAQEIIVQSDLPRRAGNPQETSRLAQPSNGPGFLGYYVGGGSIAGRRGDAPAAEDGTWGWDYQGWLLPRKINLLWWHDRRTQGGTGAYKTDGPKLPALQIGGRDSFWNE